MHFDTRLSLLLIFLVNHATPALSQHADHQSYLSLIEFNRGGSASSVILSSPHGGFLGANLTSKNTASPAPNQLPIAGCYNDTLERCVYSVHDCLSLKAEERKFFSRTDARCLTNRSSTLSMHLLTKAIAEAFAAPVRPYTVLNKLTRQYVDPAEDLLLGTFLLESATRVYADYHRLIAMAKEAIRPPARGLLIEFTFHRYSSTVQLGYGYDPTRSSAVSKPTQSTVGELVSRMGSAAVLGNYSLGHFLRLNGFAHVTPLGPPPTSSQQQRPTGHRLSTYSTRMHADLRFNAILFSYPIERLRSHSIKLEARRIARAIEQFTQSNNIKALSSSFPSTSANTLLLFCTWILFLAVKIHHA